MAKYRLTRLSKKDFDQIVADNKSLYPELAVRLPYMFVYEILKHQNTRKDPFSINTERRAVGYRIRKINGKFICDPYCWIVTNPERLLGESVNEKVKGEIYVGVEVSPELIKKYGSQANTYVQNNLSAIKSCSTPRAFNYD